MPSPTMPTCRCSGCSQRISPALGSGSTLAGTREPPTQRAIAAAVRALSSVTIATRRPSLRRAAIRGRGIFLDGACDRQHPGGFTVDRKVTQVCNEYGLMVGLGDQLILRLAETA